jgi:tRNA G46 methylase TrmB
LLLRSIRKGEIMSRETLKLIASLIAKGGKVYFVSDL